VGRKSDIPARTYCYIGEIETTEEGTTVNLIFIYDKADIANISNKELKDLIKAFHNEE
jgi:hypothetical protein